MKSLSIDIETYGSVDLTKSGVYAYANAPDFKILLFAYAFDDAGDVSRAHHAVQCGLLRVGGMRVLWQIAEFAGDTYLAGGRQHIAGDHTGQRGLACSIASDQTDLVPLGNVEVGGMQQRARTDLNLKSLRLNRHAVIPLVFRVPSNANRTS